MQAELKKIVIIIIIITYLYGLDVKGWKKSKQAELKKFVILIICLYDLDVEGRKKSKQMYVMSMKGSSDCAACSAWKAR